MKNSFANACKTAHEVAADQHYPQAALYVVATPIGNLADVTLRALHVLDLVDAIACEDTRHSRPLLQIYGVAPSKPLLAVHEHNEAEAAQGIIERLRQGQRVAFISDAGTPAVSDPGARLVAAVLAAQLQVIPVPGASSVTTALSVAGLADERGFVFAGFLPAKNREREQAIADLTQEPRAVVLLESPHRIAAVAQALAALGERRITVARELTKQFEEIAHMPAHTLPDWFAQQAQRTRGEFVLVLHPVVRHGGDDAEMQRILGLLLAELPLKTAVALTAQITHAPRNEVYAHALRLKDA